MSSSHENLFQTAGLRLRTVLQDHPARADPTEPPERMENQVQMHLQDPLEFQKKSSMRFLPVSSVLLDVPDLADLLDHWELPESLETEDSPDNLETLEEQDYVALQETRDNPEKKESLEDLDPPEDPERVPPPELPDNLERLEEQEHPELKEMVRVRKISLEKVKQQCVCGL